MTDVISSSPEYYPDEFNAATLGLAALRDNHGNSYEGRGISCKDGRQFGLSNEGNSWLMNQIHMHASLNIFREPGEIPMLFGMESPLQTMCHKFEADAHNKPVNKSMGRTK